MAPELNVNQSTFGVASAGNVNIGGNLVLGSSSEELFEKLDLPRESKVFKGRKKDIGKLQAIFFREGKRKVVIYGLPGFGKTELAVQFAKYCKDSNYIDKAFWINAETSENLKRVHKTLKRVYKYFKNKRCLFIFDNGVSRSSIRPYEPPEKPSEEFKNFYLLITSHIADWDDDIYQMPLEPLKPEASLDIFKTILGDRYEEDEKEIYTKMTTFVSNVPLGLIVIAGHLRVKMAASTQGYFDTNHFLGEISNMLNTKIHHCQSSYQNSIYAAMCVALDKIFVQEFAGSEQVRELSSKLLGICAYLNPDRIYLREIKEIMECSDKNTVDECVYLSKNFSFIDYNDGVIKIHRLCQRILKLYFDKIKKEYYSICLRWVLQKEYWQWLNGHKDTILMEADNKKETVLEIYQLNVSENNYLYIEKLLRLLVQYGCSKSCELIFHNISFEERKQFVNNMKLIHIAIQKNHADILKLFLKYGDFNVRDSQGKTPLHIASWKGNVYKVQMLLEKGADVHVRDSNNNTPLHEASWKGNIDIVRMLLEKGADMHVPGSEGKTPLHCASKEGHVDIVRMLLEKGADVHARDSNNSTPLHEASWKGNIDIVRMLLEKGADVHILDNEGKAPLHKASWKGNIEIVQMLLENGADVHVRGSEGITPLHWASWKGNIHIVRMLLEKGADVHVRDSKDITPLHWASWKGDVDIVRTLLENGADVHVRDSKGISPLNWATYFGYTDIIHILQQRMH